jgi:hypothetical protein
MIDWVSEDSIRNALLALAIIMSGLSLVISYRTAKRVRAEKAVIAWITLARSDMEWWLATLSIKNNSHLDIEVESLHPEHLEIRVGDFTKTKPAEAPDLDSGKLEDHVKMPFKLAVLKMPFKLAVAAGETKEGKFLLYQPAHSRLKKTNVNVWYKTLEAKQQRFCLRIEVQTRSDL